MKIEDRAFVVAELRRLAPAQTHDRRRAFLEAADELDVISVAPGSDTRILAMSGLEAAARGFVAVFPERWTGDSDPQCVRLLQAPHGLTCLELQNAGPSLDTTIEICVVCRRQLPPPVMTERMRGTGPARHPHGYGVATEPMDPLPPECRVTQPGDEPEAPLDKATRVWDAD